MPHNKLRHMIKAIENNPHRKNKLYALEKMGNRATRCVKDSYTDQDNIDLREKYNNKTIYIASSQFE